MKVAAATHGLPEGKDVECGHIIQLRGNRMLSGSMQRLREIFEPGPKLQSELSAQRPSSQGQRPFR